MADGLQDASRHAGQVVRRVLLRRNIAVDAETAQVVADAVQAALQTSAPSRPPRRGPRGPAADCEPLFWYGTGYPPCLQLPDNREPGRRGGVLAGGIPPWWAMLPDNTSYPGTLGSEAEVRSAKRRRDGRHRVHVRHRPFSWRTITSR